MSTILYSLDMLEKGAITPSQAINLSSQVLDDKVLVGEQEFQSLGVTDARASA